MNYTAIANAIISYKNEYYGTGVVENLDVRPSQRNAETAKESATPKAKLNTESADTKKTASKQDTTQILLVVQKRKKMDLEPRNFKGLRNISME
jgi:N-acetylmuramoyl-L-alanine amidase